MSIIARIRPSVETRPYRVSKRRPAVFAAGLETTPAPCPVASADAAAKEGRASRLPRTNGRGLSAGEWMRMNAARNGAWFDAEHSAPSTPPGGPTRKSPSESAPRRDVRPD